MTSIRFHSAYVFLILLVGALSAPEAPRKPTDLPPANTHNVTANSNAGDLAESVAARGLEDANVQSSIATLEEENLQDPSGLLFGRGLMRDLEGDGSGGLLQGEGLLSGIVSRLRPDRERLSEIFEEGSRSSFTPLGGLNDFDRGASILGRPNDPMLGGLPPSNSFLRGEDFDPHFSRPEGFYPAAFGAGRTGVGAAMEAEAVRASGEGSAFLGNAVSGSSGFGGAMSPAGIAADEVEGQMSYARAKKLGVRRCCAECHKHDIECLSNCEALCYREKECEDVGRRAYGAFCSRACPSYYMGGQNVYLPIPACEGACIARVQILCGHHACRDFGCFAPDCNERATQLCRYT